MRRWVFILGWFLLVQGAAAQTCRDTIVRSTPDSRFVVNGDEVTDSVTGLIWQRCVLGQSGSGCATGSAATHNWAGALQAAESRQQATGLAWRLPNVKELLSIVEEGCYDPAINTTVFPNTPSSYFWSGSPNAYRSPSSYLDRAWIVPFYDGNSSSNFKRNDGYVRLVRSGQ